MRNTIRDIVKHTGSLGFIETVVIEGTESVTKVESVATDNSVILKGTLRDPKSEFVGKFGFTNLNLLKQLLEFPNYKTDGAKVLMKHRERHGVKSPDEIVFEDENGSKDHYRLQATVPNQPSFLGATWNVEVAPSKSVIKEFAQRASMYGAIESKFLVTVEDGNLVFYFGDPDAATHKGTMVFEKGVTGTLKDRIYWPIAQVIQILKLSDGEDCTLSISDVGALQITIESELAEYRYILPGKKSKSED